MHSLVIDIENFEIKINVFGFQNSHFQNNKKSKFLNLNFILLI